jgi:hypothetical protein
MREPSERVERTLDDPVTSSSSRVGDEADAAGVTFELRTIERRKRSRQRERMIASALAIDS